MSRYFLGGFVGFVLAVALTGCVTTETFLRPFRGMNSDVPHGGEWGDTGDYHLPSRGRY
jgi:hypothetical protein